jgi:hypothetical protein
MESRRLLSDVGKVNRKRLGFSKSFFVARTSATRERGRLRFGARFDCKHSSTAILFARRKKNNMCSNFTNKVAI